MFDHEPYQNLYADGKGGGGGGKGGSPGEQELPFIDNFKIIILNCLLKHNIFVHQANCTLNMQNNREPSMQIKD